MISIGEALVDALLLSIEEHPRVRRAVEWVTDVASPPEGVRLVADDGAEYTGVVFVDANRPRLMLAVRSGKGTTAPADDSEPVAGRQRQRKATGSSGGDAKSYE